MPTINPLELTFYNYTGYNPNDEPASDSVIEQNSKWTWPLTIKEYDPVKLNQIKVHASDEQLKAADFLKIRDTISGKRYYYYIVNHARVNTNTVVINIILDAFATVGLGNISFFGNILRRSLSKSESENYPLLPEPWAPRRPLKVRRMIIDLNQNKTIRIPSHISTEFEEEVTHIEPNPNPTEIRVPNTVLGLTYDIDSLSFSADIPMGYPTPAPASGTTHTISTPWGNITFNTPFEQYYSLSGSGLSTFLMKAKKYNALDLLENPYYLAAPPATQMINIIEFIKPNINNKKAYKYYTTMTVRALASNSSQSYSDQNTDLQQNQTLHVIVVPDKTGGIYVIPSTIRDTGLNAYTYLDGVYSPFESVIMNAIGDTPGKFAADGTNILNQALNALFQTYVNKINALKLQGMQAGYLKDLASVKGLVMTFFGELLGGITSSTTLTPGHWQNVDIRTNMPSITQTTYHSQTTNAHSQTTSQNTRMPTVIQTQTTNIPAISGNQNSTVSEPSRTQTTGAHSQTQGAYLYNPNPSTGNVSMPSITTNVSATTTTLAAATVNTSTGTRTNAYTQNSSTNVPAHDTTTTGTISIPMTTTYGNSNTTTPMHTQNASQSSYINPVTTVTTTTADGTSRSVQEGLQIAEKGIPDVYELSSVPGDKLGWLRNVLFGSYRNEIHSFMLGNINDYLNRWVSIQNDLHNGKVANLFKNITLVGNYNDYNKFAGKYEILITSLQPEDETNFDLFLDHFGHAVDEYSATLIKDVNPNYNYVLVGEDAMLHNSVLAEASARILNQCRAGLRVWKTLIRPENY